MRKNKGGYLDFGKIGQLISAGFCCICGPSEARCGASFGHEMIHSQRSLFQHNPDRLYIIVSWNPMKKVLVTQLFDESAPSAR